MVLLVKLLTFKHEDLSWKTQKSTDTMPGITATFVIYIFLQINEKQRKDTTGTVASMFYSAASKKENGYVYLHICACRCVFNTHTGRYMNMKKRDRMFKSTPWEPKMVVKFNNFAFWLYLTFSSKPPNSVSLPLSQVGAVYHLFYEPVDFSMIWRINRELQKLFKVN